jgi:hypothetical protein
MMTSTPSFSQVGENLEQWLIEEEDNWMYEKLNEPAFLSLKVILKSSSRVLRVLLDGRHDRVFLDSSMTLTETQRNAISLLPPLDKRKLRANLLIPLFQLQLAASIPANLGDKIGKITLQRFIYFDGLSKDRFFESLLGIIRGIETIQVSLDTLPAILNDGESLK